MSEEERRELQDAEGVFKRFVGWDLEGSRGNDMEGGEGVLVRLARVLNIREEVE